MAREVAWTEVAGIDLQEIAEYIARDSKMYAASFVEDVLGASRSLDEMAERGRMVPEYGVPEIRELILGNFRLVYQVTPRAVFILRIIHGARQLPDVKRRTN